MAWSLVSITVQNQEGRPGWHDIYITITDGTVNRVFISQTDHVWTQAEKDNERDRIIAAVTNWKDPTSGKDIKSQMATIFADGTGAANEKTEAIAYLTSIRASDG